MDLVVAPGVCQLNLEKAVQVGASEAFRNVIGYFAHLSPDPVGLTLPSRDKGRKIIRNRILPMFEETEPLSDLCTGTSADMQAEQIRLLNGFVLHLMWSGSASSMASDPMRIVVNDEVNKYEAWVGNEADPITLTAMRLRTYSGRECQINLSTPTNRFGTISVLVECSDVRLEYVVPCPHCNTYQELHFERLRWDSQENETHEQRALRLMRTGDVWYECAHCGGRIVESDRYQMENKGRWASRDGTIEDAEAVAEWPKQTRIGAHISAMHCLWMPWASIAAEFLRCGKSLIKMFAFRTQTLGEPFEQQVDRARPDFFAAKVARAGLDEGIVPYWCYQLIGTVDPSHDHFWIVIRAWGPGMLSQRVWHGRIETFEDIDRLCFKHPWPVEDNRQQPRICDIVGIDSGGTLVEGDEGSRTMQVYRYVWPRRARVHALKGMSKPHPSLFIKPGRGFLDTGANKKEGRELKILYIDTQHFQDELHDQMHRGTDPNDKTEEIWLLNKRDDAEYAKQMAGMHKVAVRKKLVITDEWIPISRATPVHYRDCEVYQVAMAFLTQVHTLPSLKECQMMQEQRLAAQHAARQDKPNTWEPTSLSEYL